MWCVSCSYNQTVFKSFEVLTGLIFKTASSVMFGASDGMAEQLAKPLYLFSLCGFSTQ